MDTFDQEGTWRALGKPSNVRPLHVAVGFFPDDKHIIKGMENSIRWRVCNGATPAMENCLRSFIEVYGTDGFFVSARMFAKGLKAE